MHTIRLIVPLVVVAAAGCATLPSPLDVERDFQRQHPTYVVDGWRYRAEGSQLRMDPTKEARLREEHAVFEIEFHKPGDPEPHTFVRKYRSWVHGWTEDGPDEEVR